MKKLIPNISKMAMGGEPPKGVKPIYVSDKNDPRLKSYNDSLSLYNVYNKYNSSLTEIENSATSGKDWMKKKQMLDDSKTGQDYSNIITKQFKKIIAPIKPIRTTTYVQRHFPPTKEVPSGEGFGSSDKHYYKKPVQPIVYKPKVTPTVSNKKIQMETTKVDTTPVVQPISKTPPIPLTKKQYYEVPDTNGKVALLTPEQFSRMSSGNKNDLMSKSPIMNKPKYYYEMNSSGKRQLIPESKIREYMQTKNK